jgi:D-proline reductase (dithiol) PrdB
VSLIARGLEARGLPTLLMSNLWEATAAVKPPRTCFLDFPIGCPAGKPHEPEQQRAILRAALEAAPTFGDPWRQITLPFQWAADGSRAWEDELRAVYRRGLATVAAHGVRHGQRNGEDLLGQEREFSVRCNC